MNTILNTYEKTYQGYFCEFFRAKLGLQTPEDAEDMKLLAHLLDSMQRKYADFTQTFRDLSETSLEDLKDDKIPDSAWGLKRIHKDKTYKAFLEMYIARYANEPKTEKLIL